MRLDALLLSALSIVLVVSVWQAVRQFARVARAPADERSSGWLVRGIAAVVLGLCAACFGVAVLYDSSTAAWLGVIILAEEAWEAFMVTGVLRHDQKLNGAGAPAAS